MPSKLDLLKRDAEIAALIRALETAKAGYAPDRNDYYLGIMHGLQHAIDIVRRAAHPMNT